jgi:hypothetical protein
MAAIAMWSGVVVFDKLMQQRVSDERHVVVHLHLAENSCPARANSFMRSRRPLSQSR